MAFPYRTTRNSDMEEAIVHELRDNFNSGKTRTLQWRKTQLKALLQLVHDHSDGISKALFQDLGKHPTEAYRDEIGVVDKSARHALSCVESWMAPKKSHLPIALFPGKAEVLPEPFGVALVFSSWNFPIVLALDPVIGAISAGNAVVLKPSELAPACAKFLKETVHHYLDSKAIKVIDGGLDVAERLLDLKWDKIFFTGSPRVGRIVMTAAAKHLTPVTLELGGKCPAIFDTLSGQSQIEVAVKRIVGGKWGACSGQACIAVDYVLVEEKFASTVIDLLKKTIGNFYGENPKELKYIAKIVNKHHFDRVHNLLKDPNVAASIVHGGSLDEKKLFIEPTILLDPPLDSEVMREEIFGPILPIITLKNIEESVSFINSKPKPLALYAFTTNESFKRKILSETSSGCVSFNDILIHFICDSLPFGGVGESGFGRYHGKYSFDAFSHEKAVLQRGLFPELEARYPPWNGFKLQFIKLAYRYEYLSLFLHMLGLKRYPK